MRGWSLASFTIGVSFAALPHATAAEALRVVILPIVVHTAVEDAGYVSRGLADMLSARLEQVGSLDVVQVDDPGAGTTRLSDAVTSGRSVGGDYVIFGAFTQFGDGASLDVHCAPLGEPDLARTEAARRIFIQSGSMGEIIPKLDEIVDRVVFYLGQPVGTQQGPVAAAAVAVAPAPESDEFLELRERLEALESAVYGLEDASSAGVVEATVPES